MNKGSESFTLLQILDALPVNVFGIGSLTADSTSLFRTFALDLSLSASTAHA